MIVIQMSFHCEISQEHHNNEKCLVAKTIHTPDPSRMFYWFKPSHPLELPVKVDTFPDKF